MPYQDDARGALEEFEVTVRLGHGAVLAGGY
jgi:hypothetical protein